jgi:hypothetical protein
MNDLGEKIPLNKEVKLVLLKALKNGFITRGEADELAKAFGIQLFVINFVDEGSNAKDDNRQVGVGAGD